MGCPLSGCCEGPEPRNSAAEERCRPSPKRHNLLALWAPALPCVVWKAPHVTRADLGPASPCVVRKAPHVTRADIGSLDLAIGADSEMLDEASGRSAHRLHGWKPALAGQP
jgi:hypothetical protein